MLSAYHSHPHTVQIYFSPQVRSKTERRVFLFVVPVLSSDTHIHNNNNSTNVPHPKLTDCTEVYSSRMNKSKFYMFLFFLEWYFLFLLFLFLLFFWICFTRFICTKIYNTYPCLSQPIDRFCNIAVNSVFFFLFFLLLVE